MVVYLVRYRNTTASCVCFRYLGGVVYTTKALAVRDIEQMQTQPMFEGYEFDISSLEVCDH